MLLAGLLSAMVNQEVGGGLVKKTLKTKLLQEQKHIDGKGGLVVWG